MRSFTHWVYSCAADRISKPPFKTMGSSAFTPTYVDHAPHGPPSLRCARSKRRWPFPAKTYASLLFAHHGGGWNENALFWHVGGGVFFFFARTTQNAYRAEHPGFYPRVRVLQHHTPPQVPRCGSTVSGNDLTRSHPASGAKKRTPLDAERWCDVAVIQSPHSKHQQTITWGPRTIYHRTKSKINVRETNTSDRKTNSHFS